MFAFALAFSAGHRYFSLDFQEEEGIWKKTLRTKITDHNYYICQAWSVKLIALLALQHTFHLSERKCISKS